MVHPPATRLPGSVYVAAPLFCLCARWRCLVWWLRSVVRVLLVVVVVWCRRRVVWCRGRVVVGGADSGVPSGGRRGRTLGWCDFGSVRVHGASALSDCAAASCLRSSSSPCMPVTSSKPASLSLLTPSSFSSSIGSCQSPTARPCRSLAGCAISWRARRLGPRFHLHNGSVRVSPKSVW